MKSIYKNMVKVDLGVQFKISIKKRKFEIKSIRLRFLMLKTKVKCLHKEVLAWVRVERRRRMAKS